MEIGENIKTKTGSHTVAEFSISFTQYLDEQGQLKVDTLPASLSDQSVLLEVYKTMYRARAIDQKAINLQRTGKLGTYSSVLGQEAIGTSVASVMLKDDVLFPTYRELGAQLWRGVKMEDVLLYWGGDERGSDFKIPRQDFPVCIPIATQALHAVGVAYAMKLRKQARAAVCFVGDGATSKGDFHEAINAAGTWRVPVLFIVSNNQWAISVPTSKQSAAQTFAQKAIAAGFESEQVDGNDALVVRARADRAIKRTRDGAGPYLIEAITYRMSDHTTSDDASRYRSQAELEKYRQKDPVLRLRRYLNGISAWDESKENALMLALDKEVQEAVDNYQNTPLPPVESMFDYLYAELPESFHWQRKQASLKAMLKGQKDGSDEGGPDE